jgi:hypothetical protein
MRQVTLSGKARYSTLRRLIKEQPGWYRGENFVPDGGVIFFIKRIHARNN